MTETELEELEALLSSVEGGAHRSRSMAYTAFCRRWS